MVKRRRSAFVSPDSKDKLIVLQGKQMELTKKKVSLQDVLDNIIKNTNIEEFEKKILGNDRLPIKFD